MSVPTFESARIGGTLHLGKQDAAPLHPSVIRYSELRRSIIKAGVTIPRVPESWTDFALDFRDWGMKGNGPQDDNAYPPDWAAAQGAGDCTCAGAGNETQEDAKNAGAPVPPIGTKTTIKQYSLLTGEANGEAYDPRTGAGDTGLNVQQVNAYRQQHGFLDDNGKAHKIGQVVALAPGNLQEYVEAVYLFEKVGLGVMVQEAQMQQFENGEPWDWVSNEEPEGGHYIPGMYRLPNGRPVFVTWTKATVMTDRYYEHAVDEAYAHISFEAYNRVTGEDANHFTEQDAEKFIVLVARMKVGIVAS